MSYPIFEGNDLNQWFKIYNFSDQFIEYVTNDLAVNHIRDLNLVYEDKELLAELERHTKRLEFVKFKKLREVTVILNEKEGEPLVKKSTVNDARHKELLEWVSKNELPSNLITMLENNEIFDLANLLFPSNSSNGTSDSVIESISSQLDVFASIKFRQAIQELKDRYLFGMMSTHGHGNNQNSTLGALANLSNLGAAAGGAGTNAFPLYITIDPTKPISTTSQIRMAANDLAREHGEHIIRPLSELPYYVEKKKLDLAAITSSKSGAEAAVLAADNSDNEGDAEGANTDPDALAQLAKRRCRRRCAICHGQTAYYCETCSLNPNDPVSPKLFCVCAFWGKDYKSCYYVHKKDPLGQAEKGEKSATSKGETSGPTLSGNKRGRPSGSSNSAAAASTTASGKDSTTNAANALGLMGQTHQLLLTGNSNAAAPAASTTATTGAGEMTTSEILSSISSALIKSALTTTNVGSIDEAASATTASKKGGKAATTANSSTGQSAPLPPASKTVKAVAAANKMNNANNAATKK